MENFKLKLTGLIERLKGFQIPEEPQFLLVVMRKFNRVQVKSVIQNTLSLLDKEMKEEQKIGVSLLKE